MLGGGINLPTPKYILFLMPTATADWCEAGDVTIDTLPDYVLITNLLYLPRNLLVPPAVVEILGTRLPQLATNHIFITQEPASSNFLQPQNTNQGVSEYLAIFPHFCPSRY